MSTLLSLSAPDLDDESLHDLTRRLCRDLQDEAGLDSALAKEPAAPGTKGDLELVGQILIKAVGAGGAVVALVNVLKSYLERKRTLRFEFRAPDGRQVTIQADDLRGDETAKLVQAIKKVLEDSGH